MRFLSSQPDLRQAREAVDFCYLCGEPLSSEPSNAEHVVARRIFDVRDRINPLILGAHVRCNGSQSRWDAAAAELLWIPRGKLPHEKRRQAIYYLGTAPGVTEPVGGVGRVPIDQMIVRWVRGFHAALYAQFLPDERHTGFSVSSPFPRGRREGANNFVVDPVPLVHSAIVEQIRLNRLTRTLDVVSIYNEKCRYECTWSHMDHGPSCCLFALNIYEWKRLGRTPGSPERNCVGVYVPRAGRPRVATKATLIDGSALRLAGLDPFDP